MCEVALSPMQIYTCNKSYTTKNSLLLIIYYLSYDFYIVFAITSQPQMWNWIHGREAGPRAKGPSFFLFSFLYIYIYQN